MKPDAVAAGSASPRSRSTNWAHHMALCACGVVLLFEAVCGAWAVSNQRGRLPWDHFFWKVVSGLQCSHNGVDVWRAQPHRESHHHRMSDRGGPKASMVATVAVKVAQAIEL